MLNEQMRKTEKSEIELSLLKEIKDHDGLYHKRTLAHATGYAEGTVLKYLQSLIDRKIIVLKEDGRNQKLFTTDRTDKKIRELEGNGTVPEQE